VPAQPPNLGQLLLVCGAIVMVLTASILAQVRLRHPSNSVRLASKSLQYWAICFGLAALVWHCWSRGSLLFLQDNFESLLALGLLPAIFVVYMRRVRPLPALDLFLLPIIALLLASAAIFGRLSPSVYHTDGWWFWAHRLTTYGSAVAFAVAAAGGGMYLIASARLRRKNPDAAAPLGNLERLERITHTGVACGFALLTVGIITGVLRLAEQGSHTRLGPHWMTNPQIWLGFSVWVVYALALHTPINPSARGRRSALLSIVGFCLMFGTLIAVQFMPGGR
jgi:ABC-type transport system involved in cytochrome c biogenesis permease subunit